MTDRCPDCNALYAMVGRRHNCVPRPASSTVEQSLCKREAGGSNPPLGTKRARSSAVEPSPHKALVAGSTPAAPTNGCPICAERREAKRKSQAKWRKRKQSI